MFLGLRTAIYRTADLAESKAWFTTVLGQPPYFDEPFYVGFEVAGYELGLLPDDDTVAGPRRPDTYWGVPDAAAAVAVLVDVGATVLDAVIEVGGGIRTASVVAPDGAVVGVIENPRFSLAEATPASDGPGL